MHESQSVGFVFSDILNSNLRVSSLELTFSFIFASRVLVFSENGTLYVAIYNLGGKGDTFKFLFYMHRLLSGSYNPDRFLMFRYLIFIGFILDGKLSFFPCPDSENIRLLFFPFLFLINISKLRLSRFFILSRCSDQT